MMRNPRPRRTRAAAALGVAAALVLTGCSISTGTAASDDAAERDDGMGDDGVFTVAAFTAGYAVPGGKLTLDAFVEHGSEQENWDVTLYTSTFDYDKINSDVQTAITNGADAILAGFPDPRQIAPLVQAADAAGIPIFSIDGGTEANDDFVLDVTFDQQQLAELTVGGIEQALGGLDGRTVMVIGHDPHIGIQKRSQLAHDMLVEAGATIAGGEIRKAIDPGTGRTEALNFVTDYLQANPGDLDAVWVGWDDAAMGVTQALEEAGLDDVPVTGVDATAEAVEKIRAGSPFYGSVAQDWIAVVDQVIGEMNTYRDTGAVPDDNFVEVEGVLIDPSNADDFEPTL